MYRILNFIGNSISVFDQATCLQVGVSGEARFPNAFPILRSESHNIIDEGKYKLVSAWIRLHGNDLSG